MTRLGSLSDRSASTGCPGRWTLSSVQTLDLRLGKRLEAELLGQGPSCFKTQDPTTMPQTLPPLPAAIAAAS